MANPPPLYPFWNDSQTVLLRKILTNTALIAGAGVPAGFGPVPATPAAPGVEGDLAEDGSYLYVYSATAGQWLRTPLSDWTP